MSNEFRELLRKIGSGPHTGTDLTRAEANEATKMMLRQEATPAQIGAFLIAHRMKRPTGAELAGMLDAYEELGQKLTPLDPPSPVTVFSCPYDGRSRTAPITPLTALILTAAGHSVIMHGGDRMPTKEGIPFMEIWQGLGISWGGLSLAQVQQVFQTTKLGFIYLPQHFPDADRLVPYRSQIGKRPPLSTLELIWCPYTGNAHLVSGFVHPPTEDLFRVAFALRGKPQRFTTVKGLEGSCDLPRDRTAIIGMGEINADANITFERLLLHPHEYGFDGKEVALEPTNQLVEQIQTVLQGKSGELQAATIWNAGFYLWCCGVCADLPSGFTQAKTMLTNGQVASKLEEIKQVIRSLFI